MVTIAFGQVFYFIAFRWNSVTGGDDGLTGWQRQPLDLGFTDDRHPRQRQGVLLPRAGSVRAVRSAIMALLLRSPFGRTLIAIRENERRARFLGIPVEQHIWISFVISCFFVSLAGTLYALLSNFTDPRALHWTQSGNFVIMAVLGGMRSFWGPLIGAAIFVVLQDYVSSHTENWMSFIGLFFVLVVLFFPRGVLGIIERKVRVMSLLQVRERVAPLRQPGRRQRRFDDGRAGRAARRDRPQRRRQDHVLQHDQRILSADLRHASSSTTATSPRWPAHKRVARGMARTFQITEIFPELTVRENLRIPVEVAAGLRLRPWLSRAAARRVRARLDELLEHGRARRQGRPAGRRALARRPARHRDHDVAGAEAAPAAARRADRRHGRPGNLRRHAADPTPAPRRSS